jgi:hypothetical protein
MIDRLQQIDHVGRIAGASLAAQAGSEKMKKLAEEGKSHGAY